MCMCRRAGHPVAAAAALGRCWAGGACAEDAAGVLAPGLGAARGGHSGVDRAPAIGRGWCKVSILTDARIGVCMHQCEALSIRCPAVQVVSGYMQLLQSGAEAQNRCTSPGARAIAGAGRFGGVAAAAGGHVPVAAAAATARRRAAAGRRIAGPARRGGPRRVQKPRP